MPASRRDCSATLQVHHVVAINDGGDPFALENLVLLCGSHHHRLERETRRQHMELIEKETIIDS